MSRTTVIHRSLLLCVCLIALLGAVSARAQPPPPDDPLNQVGFDQRLNEQIPLDLVFRDETGELVRLGGYFVTKPVILTLNYYECPNLCTLVLTQLVETMRKLPFDVGNQFEVITVSIDPRETPAIASAKKATYIERYGRPDAADGWHFLTGEQAAIEQLAQAIGVRYAYDARQDQYAHPSGITVLTPQGKISRYFYGIAYSPTDLRLGLVDASAGKIGSPVDQLLLRCYRYDPVTGRYTVAIMSIVRVVGIATILILGVFVLAMVRRERRSTSLS
jgi:protein SCO1/2